MSLTRHKPRWNIASLIAPLVGILAAIPVYFIFGAWFGTLFDIYVLLGFSAFGVLFAVISFARLERWMIVSLVGLVVNSLPWIWFAANYDKQITGPHF